MSRLFKRFFRILINEDRTSTGDVDVQTAREIESGNGSHLRVSFSVEKNILQDQLNSAEVTIYNLSKETRALIQKRFAPLTIEAGYEENHGLVYSGQVTIASHVKTGPDWMTKFSTLDGMQQISTTHLNETLAPGVTIQQVFSHLVEKMGIGPGNFLQRLNQGLPSAIPGAFTDGFSMDGRAYDIIGELSKSAGLDFSIQDNTAQLLGPGEGIGPISAAVILDPEHGLIGNAEESEDRERHQAVVAKSLMNSSLRPGRLVLLTSRNIETALYRVYSVKHHGDSHGQEWYSDLVLNPIPDSLIFNYQNAVAESAIA